MNDWKEQFDQAIFDFMTVAELGSVSLPRSEIEIEHLPAPHRAPSRLPTGKMAVYAFWGDGCWLKVGMAGPNSNARYTSQHYSAGSAPSTLAASLIKWSAATAIDGFRPEAAGDWLRATTHRANVLLPASQPRELLALLEAFLHLRLRPRHER